MSSVETTDFMPAGMALPEESPGPFCAVALNVDGSGSTALHGRNAEINEGIATMAADLKTDELARNRVELGIVEIHSTATETVTPTLVRNLADVPSITPGGLTAIGAAMDMSTGSIDTSRRRYRDMGVKAYVPFSVLFTDGMPTDEWRAAAARVHARQAAGKLNWLVIGTSDCDEDTLKELAGPHRPPMKVRDGEIRTMFQWISDSLKSVSASTPGTAVPLTSGSHWGTVVA